MGHVNENLLNLGHGPKNAWVRLLSHKLMGPMWVGKVWDPVQVLNQNQPSLMSIYGEVIQ